MSELFPSETPQPDEHLLAQLRLQLVPGIGPRHQRTLLQYFETADRVLAASIGELEQVSGIGPKLAMQIHTARQSTDAIEQWSACREHGFHLLQLGTDDYPKNLSEVEDAPLLLFCRGELQERDEMAVGIVGSRRCTVYGQQQAEKLARSLAMAGLTIVSGLARGIDAAAHRGALAAGGRTIAVSATGLLNVYPPEHSDLAAQIAESGAIVCENRLDQPPASGMFPQRNRIISGMSVGVIIIEANRRSGALHTSRHAMEQGREVMAVPGRIDSIASEGCHDLIRDGVTLVRHADDVLEELGPLIQPVQTSQAEEIRSPRELVLSEQQRAILNLVTNDPQHLDEIIRESGLEPSRVLATLTILEMKRMVRRMPGGLLIRVTH